MATPSGSRPAWLGIPVAPLALGVSGLIPFWGLALALLIYSALGRETNRIVFALAAYAAIIISFLGGIRWGLAVAAKAEDVKPYAISVVPSLVAWAALAAPGHWRFVILGLVALALGPLDLELVRSGQAPAWFGRLRMILSTGAGIALLMAAFG
jgi:Protein of unknown function (DUF3429)